MQLRQYQWEALEAVNEFEAKGIRRQLIVLPTGTGKTVIFSHLPKTRKDSLPMLVLAHREELLNQAKDKIERANPELTVAIEQGSNYAGRPDVVIASVATLGRSDEKRLRSFGKDYFRAVVIDEAHHAAAPTYRRVLDYFDSALHLGVTATPQRGDNTRLTDVFDEIVYYKTIREMIEDAWLAPLRGFRLSSDTDLSGVSTRAGDFAEGELSQAVNTPERNMLVLRAFKDILHGGKTLVFCVDVSHATDIYELAKKNGIAAGLVHGATPSDERAHILKEFSKGNVQLLANCMVLTEGFDEPSIAGIIMARPTQSQLLYTQIVGRGTRTFPGKQSCTVVDIADTVRTKVPVGLPTLMGLPPDFDLDGNDLLKATEDFERLENKAPSLLANVKSLADLEAAWEKVDLFTPPPPNPALLEFSSFIWLAINDGSYFLGLGPEESLHLQTDALGRCSVEHLVKQQRISIAQSPDLRTGFSTADQWVKENRSDKVVLLDLGARWRADPPTEKQIKWLKKFGAPYEHLSKGEASQVLDKLFAEKPKKQRPAWLERKIQAQKKGF